MHLFDPGRIFPTEFFPRRIFFKLQKSVRIDWMEGTMNVLAQTADDVGIEKAFAIYARNSWRLQIITVIPGKNASPTRT
jgi:hypothetical protein